MQRLIAVFITLLAASGVVSAIIVGRYPHLEQSSIQPFWWPLGVALVFDLVTRPLVHQGRMPELPMSARFAGVIIGALVYQGLRIAFPTA